MRVEILYKTKDSEEPFTGLLDVANGTSRRIIERLARIKAPEGYAFEEIMTHIPRRPKCRRENSRKRDRF